MKDDFGAFLEVAFFFILLPLVVHVLCSQRQVTTLCLGFFFFTVFPQLPNLFCNLSFIRTADDENRVQTGLGAFMQFSIDWCVFCSA